MDKAAILKEIKIDSARSSGPGGQNVNKVETKIFVVLLIRESNGLTEVEKEKIIKKLNLDEHDPKLQVQCQETRSQLKNKEIAIKKLFQSINAALKPVKERQKTTPTENQKEERLMAKKRDAEIKKSRSKFEF